MDRIAYAKIRNGYYATADGNHQTGTIQGDYSTGFWAFRLNGTRVMQEFATPRDAAEVLALEFAMDYGHASARATFSRAPADRCTLGVERLFEQGVPFQEWPSRL